MARHRVKPIHPFIQTLMDECSCATLKEYSEFSGIPYDTLVKYANSNGSHQVYAALLRDAQLAFPHLKLREALERFVTGFLRAG